MREAIKILKDLGAVGLSDPSGPNVISLLFVTPLNGPIEMVQIHLEKILVVSHSLKLPL